MKLKVRGAGDVLELVEFLIDKPKRWIATMEGISTTSCRA